jgi:hypothetical protein
MNSGGNYVSVWNWAWVKTGSHETREVSHIDPKFRSYLIGNCPEGREI